MRTGHLEFSDKTAEAAKPLDLEKASLEAGASSVSNAAEGEFFFSFFN